MVAGETGTLNGLRPTETLDPFVQLLVPEHEISDGEPELSIVIPALNEELTVGDFVEWCREGLAAAGVAGEVLIVDSSTDRTAEIALEHGARVLKTPRRGLGRAYIDALRFARGRYILMGDADCTYDFRRLGDFVEKLREGYEFVMGSRWRGSIEPGSMPALHRYLGTPVTTWILNLLYRSSLLRHPLRHAGDHEGRARAHGAAARSPGSTRPRWCSSPCAWSSEPPRCRSPS